MSAAMRVSAALLALLECLLRVLAEVLIVFPSMLIGALGALLASCAGGRRKKFKSVFITGASSGLGAALARRLSAPGVRLVLTARRVDKLEEAADFFRLSFGFSRRRVQEGGQGAAPWRRSTRRSWGTGRGRTARRRWRRSWGA